MGGLTARWRGLSGAGRGGVIGAGWLVVTGAAAVLLAVWARQPWVPALAPVLLLVPGLYLAAKAVPGPARLPQGRRAGAWNPADLEVHQAAGGGRLPLYIRRPHDGLLDALLDPAVTRSRLVAVRGGSSTGKTRAAYEAVTQGRLARWRLEYPLNADALTGLLEAGIPPQTVLWLGELRQYTDGEDAGAAALGRLARLLETQNRLIAITTIWPEHWTAYAEAARTDDNPMRRDPAATAGRLLGRLPDCTGYGPEEVAAARGGVIDIPPVFTTSEVIAAARASQVLADAAAAAAAAGQDGQIAQYLAGVPDLLNRFQGAEGSRYGQAVIIASMDAARLGFESPLPEALLLEATPGYLTESDRTRELSSWAGPAMKWATEKLRGDVRALIPVPPPHGTGIAGYRPADYLDQHSQLTRQEETGTPELWDALAAHTAGTADLIRLAEAAENRGLFRHAAALYTSAVAQGSLRAANLLLSLLSKKNSADVSRAGRWAVAHITLDDDPVWVAGLLGLLGQAGASEAVTALLSRDPASHASLDDPFRVTALLYALLHAGAGEAVTALENRAAAHASLDDAASVALLIRHLWQEDAIEPATVLANRAAAHVSLDRLFDIVTLLNMFRHRGLDEATTVLANRAAAHVGFDITQGVDALVDTLDLENPLPSADLTTQPSARAPRWEGPGLEPGGPWQPWTWQEPQARQAGTQPGRGPGLETAHPSMAANWPTQAAEAATPPLGSQSPSHRKIDQDRPPETSWE
jgi:hypothetical protein